MINDLDAINVEIHVLSLAVIHHNKDVKMSHGEK